MLIHPHPTSPLLPLLIHIGVVYPGPLDVKETYSAWPAYGRSKLASVYFARVCGAWTDAGGLYEGRAGRKWLEAMRSLNLSILAPSFPFPLPPSPFPLPPSPLPPSPPSIPQGFNQRYAADGVTAYSLHPGNIATELARNMGAMASISNAFARLVGKTIPEGAATTMFCALSDKAVPGEYHDESNVDMNGAHPLFRDQGQVDALWATSEKIMREKLGL